MKLKTQSHTREDFRFPSQSSEAEKSANTANLEQVREGWARSRQNGIS